VEGQSCFGVLQACRHRPPHSAQHGCLRRPRKVGRALSACHARAVRVPLLREHQQIDPTRPAKGWRTAWRHALKLSGVRCRFHDLRVTCITKMAESLTPDLVIMSVAGHLSRAMLEHYSRIRTEAKRAALEGLAQPDFEVAVHQNVHQLPPDSPEAHRNLLN
jgi:hypothetical protein